MRLQWNALALLVFAVIWAALFHDILGPGFSERVVSSSWGALQDPDADQPVLASQDSLVHTDQRFVVWLTARNAWTLSHRPLGLFDAEPCYPARGSLAFGEPGLSLGLLGAPAMWLSGDPVATFNLVFLAMTMIAAYAMYLLVREWTGEPGAGVVAGVLYAFSEIKLADVVHIHVYDNAWTVLALLFASRLFVRSRWRDAIGLSLCVVMQLGGSFYTVLAASLVAVPFTIWLLIRYGVGALRPAQMALILLSMAAVSAVIFPPYLELRQAGGLKEQTLQAFRSLSHLLPAADGFWGWVTLALALLALAMPRERVLLSSAGDPRLALLVGVGLAVAFSTAALTGRGTVLVETGSGGLVPYSLLAELIPGLGVVRGPGAILPAAHLLLCVLAGMGAAGLIRRAGPQRAVWLTAALILLAVVETLRPAILGLTPRVRYGAMPMAPHVEELEAFERLQEMGDRGPLLEVPVLKQNLLLNSRGVLLSSYHHRRTSACYNTSRIPPELVQLGRELPAGPALARAREMGFTSIVLHHHRDDRATRSRHEAFEAASDPEARAPLRKLTEGERLSVYRIEP